jgi:hypothetical protein
MIAGRAKDHVRYGVAIVTVGVLAGAFAILFRGAMRLVFVRLFQAPDVFRAALCPGIIDPRSIAVAEN